MNKRVYFLMVVSFVIGMVELIISGILDLLVDDLNITLSQAGFLITIFSFIFAVASPVLLVITASIERKKLTLYSLFIFLIGNIITVFSTTYTFVLIGRIISATSGALLIILCLVMAPQLVEQKYRGRAIGIVSMGVSGSLVLGVPLGLLLGSAFGWRAPFVFISILTILSIIGVFYFMNKVEPQPQIPIKTQLATLKDTKISLAHMTTFLYMTGHSMLYAYLKPYIQEMTNLGDTWISAIYFLFGISAVFGGGLGGTLSDLLGSKKTIIVSIIGLSAILFIVPLSLKFLIFCLISIMIWGMLSWIISPAMQHYLIDTSPETGAIQQSLANSSLHLGIAFGSLIGGQIIDQISISINPFIGGVIVALSLITAMISIKKQPNRMNNMAYLKEIK